MKNIFFTLLIFITALNLSASPDIYTPQLVGPANNAVNIFPDVDLDWNAVTGDLGLHYEAQLDTTADFTNPTTFTTDVTKYKMSNLEFGRVYYWRVRAIDNSETSEWSETRSFTVTDIVTISRPTDNANNVDANVVIIWQRISGVTHFDLQFDTINTFDSPAMTMTSVGGNLQTTTANALYFGKTYNLRMRARHATDTSAWSNIKVFTVNNLLNLKTPNNNATGLSPNAEFSWNKINGIQKYQLIISEDAEMEHYEAYNVSAALTSPKFIPDTLMFGTTYYWQVTGVHANDTLFSEVRNITTVNNVTLTAPSNNATNIELQPILSWQAITGLLSYQIDIANNIDFNSAYSYSVAGATEFKIPLNVVDSAKVYYWRVRAISSRDTSEYSDTWSFRTVALGMGDQIKVQNAKIYPSPASSKVNISLRSNYNGVAEIEVYDLLGSVRLKSKVNFTNGLLKDMPINNLTNGIYMVSILFDGKMYTSKLIIQK